LAKRREEERRRKKGGGDWHEPTKSGLSHSFTIEIKGRG